LEKKSGLGCYNRLVIGRHQQINITEVLEYILRIGMEKNEFEDLGKDIWVRLLRKTQQFPNPYMQTNNKKDFKKDFKEK